MQEVVAAYKDPGTDGVKQVQSTGLHIAGERFIVIKADERSVYGKKVSLCERSERRGLGEEKKMEGEEEGVGSAELRRDADCEFLSWITRVLGQDEDTGSVWDMIC
jgi:hypothetical protein